MREEVIPNSLRRELVILLPSIGRDVALEPPCRSVRNCPVGPLHAVPALQLAQLPARGLVVRPERAPDGLAPNFLPEVPAGAASLPNHVPREFRHQLLLPGRNPSGNIRY